MSCQLALDTLQQAIAAGFNNADQLRQAAELTPLHPLPDSKSCSIPFRLKAMRWRSSARLACVKSGFARHLFSRFCFEPVELGVELKSIHDLDPIPFS
jgi:hypothetical protein